MAYRNCVDQENTISGHLFNKGYQTIGLGMSGNGPLLEFAVLKEYALKLDPYAIIWVYFENDIIAEVNAAITKDEADKVIIEGTKGTISMTNPWTLGKDGGPYQSSIILQINSKKEVINIEGHEHLFYFEADIASRSIISKKTEALPPSMTWDDTLGNLSTLDSWRKEIGYKLPADQND